MHRLLPTWFRRNAYGIFTLRILVALGSACVAILLSFLPYDTILQAIWVVVSTLFMASLVLRERLNESDDNRYRRLSQNRFSFLQEKDPEALTTIFAENIRPRVLNWFQSEFGVPIEKAETIDALDSLARNGDAPGQLIFRTGVELGQWLTKAEQEEDKIANLASRLATFVKENVDLLGEEVSPGIFLRHIRRGEQRPVGVHMFHDASKLLLTIEYYGDEEKRTALALSAKASFFENDAEAWANFQRRVHENFKCFQPAHGGSGPQKPMIPYFVGAISDTPVASHEDLVTRLKNLSEFFNEPLAPKKRAENQQGNESKKKPEEN